MCAPAASELHDVMIIVTFDGLYMHSLRGNSIGREGAVALSEALKSMTTLQELE